MTSVAPSDPKATRGTPWVVWALVAAVFRIAAAALVPVLPEEAYHWCYARHLSTGYYDHPPMIAWMIAMGRWLFGDTALGIRFVPVLGSLATSIALGSLSSRLHGNDAARWTVLLLAVQPATFVGSAFGFPDAPLLLFWSLSMLFVIHALQSRRAAWWPAAGAAWGAALLSKYTAFFFAGSLLLYLAVSPRDRGWLRTPWPYVAVVVGLLVFSPVLHWNATHDWASFRFQSVHRFERMESPSPAGAGVFLAAQWGAILPLTLPLAVAAAGAALRRRTPGDLLLLCLSLPMLFFFLLVGAARATHVFWPLPAYLSLVVLMGEAAARGSGRIPRLFRAGRGWILGASAVAILAVTVHVVHPFPRIPTLRGVYDWDVIAERVRGLRADLPAESFVLGVGKRYLCAAQLAFYLDAPEEVQAKNLLGEEGLQFAYWTRLERLRNRDAVVVVDGGWSPQAETLLRKRFHTVERTGEWTVFSRAGPRREQYLFFVARGYSPP